MTSDTRVNRAPILTNVTPTQLSAMKTQNAQTQWGATNADAKKATMETESIA